MKKTKTPPTEEQIQDSIRLRKLFADRAGMSQLEFGQAYGVGNQGMVWQYLNADKPKGSVLNVFAAIKFAEGLHCRVSDFSPSIQEEIDRIASFSTKPGDAMKLPITTEKPVTNAAPAIRPVDVAPKATQSKEDGIANRYASAPRTSQAAIEVILLPQSERDLLRESVEGRRASSAIEILETDAEAAINSLHERKKTKNGTKPD